MFPPCRLFGSEAATILPALVTLLLMAGTACGQDVGDANRGKLVYEKYCVLCHGEQGGGKGHFSQDTTPVPRDFRQGTFKWRSTPSGSLPTDADLERVLMTGLYGTSMSSFAITLSHQQRLDVIAYIKTFSPRFATEKPEPPITIPPEPPYTDKSVERGPAIYRVFITGLTGTPMPSFADSISPEEAWDLVHFIQSLSPLYPKNVAGGTPKPVDEGSR